ncbi:hypothetical protein BH24ACI3_BH24ACI3_03940 [soil metagenome]
MTNKSETTEAEEVIDVEEFAKAGNPVPSEKTYKIRIDKTNYTVKKTILNGREILALAGLTPEKYQLNQHVRGGQTIPIGADQEVDLTQPGVERFSILKIENTEGSN